MMKEKKINLFKSLSKSMILVVLFIFSLCAVSWAEEGSSNWSNGKELGMWWKKTAHNYDPIPEPWLYHLEGSIAFTKLSGNLDAEIIQTDAALFLRKKLFTSITQGSANTNDTEVNMKNKDITVDKYSFNQMFAYDINDKLSLGAGVIWERDNAIFLLDRWTYYSGGKYSFFTKPPFLFNVGLYYGYEDNTYDSDYIRGDFDLDEDTPAAQYVGALWESAGGIPETYDSEGIRFMESFTWMLNQRVTLLHNFEYMMYFKDSDYYHWKTALTIQVGITKNISFFTRYQIKYEESLLAERFGKVFDDPVMEGYDVYTRDELLIVGLKFSL